MRRWLTRLDAASLSTIACLKSDARPKELSQPHDGVRESEMTPPARVVVLLASLLVLLRAATSWATFHLSTIDEVMSGLNGDPTAQYVEIKMLAGGQTAVSHARLTAFNCDGSMINVLLEVPRDICNGGAGLRWSAGTASWATATGVIPDFPLPPGIFTPCGQVCWGAPGIFPPNPPTWDASNPANYVDCVAYGGYAGPRQTGDAAATTLAPGDGTMSLQRMADTGNDLADFALAPRTPENNGCATTTTTLPQGGGGACKDSAAVASTRAQVAAQCVCADAPNHATYVKCAGAVAKMAVKAGTLPKACKGAVKRCAAKSTCGKSGFVTCCRTNAHRGQTCSIKRRAAACKAPKGGTACVGDVSSCCDACGGATCPTVTTTTTPTGTTRPRTTTTHVRTTTTSTTAASCTPTGRSCTTSAQCCSRYCYLGQCS